MEHSRAESDNGRISYLIPTEWSKYDIVRTHLIGQIINKNQAAPFDYSTDANSSSNLRWKQNSFLEAIIKRSNLSTQYGSYLLANARLEGYPIVHASDKFVRQTGYCKADIVRKPATLEFLQGEEHGSKFRYKS